MGWVNVFRKTSEKKMVNGPYLIEIEEFKSIKEVDCKRMDFIHFIFSDKEERTFTLIIFAIAMRWIFLN
jgi:hypothetical protein